MRKFLTWYYITVCILSMSGNLLASDEHPVQDSTTPLFVDRLQGTLETDHEDMAILRSLALSEREKQVREGHNPEISEEREEEEEVRRQFTSKKRVSPEHFFVTIFGGDPNCFPQFSREIFNLPRHSAHRSSTRQHVRLRVFRI